MTEPATITECSPTFSPTQRESRWLIALVFVGMALRLLAVVLQPGSLKTDPDAYVVHAEAMIATGGYHVPGSSLPTAYRPPLYPILLAGLRVVGFKMTVAIGVINAISGALVIIATWWTARIIGLRGRWPGIAAGATVVDPLLLKYTALPMTETLAAGLLSFAVLQMLKSRIFASADGQSVAGSSPTRSAIVAGVFFGLSGLCRPVALITCAGLTACQLTAFCWRRFRRRSPEHTSTAVGRTILLPALVAGLVMMPWVIRNAVQFNAFLPVTTHGGYTLLLGNNATFYRDVVLADGQPVWSGTSFEDWQQQLQDDMKADGIDQFSQTAVDRWMYDRAGNAIQENPSAFMKACMLRLRRFWALGPTVEPEGNGLRWYFVAAWYLMLWIGLAWGLLLSVRAVFTGAADSVAAVMPGRADLQGAGPSRNCIFPRMADIHLLWLAVLSFVLLHTFYWTNARMRAPLMGILSVLAVTGWRSVFELWHRRRIRNT